MIFYLVAENFQNGYVRTLILRNEKDTFNVLLLLSATDRTVPSKFYSANSKSILAREVETFLEQDVFNIGTKSTSYAMNISHTRLAESKWIYRRLY